MRDINIFRDPPTQAEIEGALRLDRNKLTTGERIALGPGVLGLEVLVGAAVDAIGGETNFMTAKASQWEAQRGAVGWDWSKSIFAQSYVKKVRAMNRELVRGEVTALTRQFNMEQQAVDAVKDAGTMAGNIADALISRVVGKQ